MNKEIVKELPLYKTGEITKTYSEILWYTNNFKLVPITEGVDSIAIRIWCNYPDNKTQIVELFKTNGQWAANFYHFNFKYYNNDSITWISRQIKSEVPKSGWDKCIDKLFSQGLLSLPNFTELPKYHLNKIGNSEVVVEFVTDEKYKLYSYPVPAQNESFVPQAKQIENILDVIEDEFSFKRFEIL